MQRSRGILLALSLGVLLFDPRLFTVTSQQPRGERAHAVLAITLPGRPSFHFPVAASNSVQGFAVIPVLSTQISAVKIAPRMDAEAIQIDVSALSGTLAQITSCDQLKGLKEQSVASYHAKIGDVIRLSELVGFGVREFEIPEIKVTTGDDLICPVGCCCCGDLRCCPNPGYCVECGPCALCCR